MNKRLKRVKQRLAKQRQRTEAMEHEKEYAFREFNNTLHKYYFVDNKLQDTLKENAELKKQLRSFKESPVLVTYTNVSGTSTTDPFALHQIRVEPMCFDHHGPMYEHSAHDIAEKLAAAVHTAVLHHIMSSCYIEPLPATRRF